MEWVRVGLGGWEMQGVEKVARGRRGAAVEVMGEVVLDGARRGGREIKWKEGTRNSVELG